MSSFIDTYVHCGAGLTYVYYVSTYVCIWFIFSPSIELQKQFYNCEANDLGMVWCSYNKRMNRLCVYRYLLTNRVHGKAAELCLANSWNNSVTATKYKGTCSRCTYVFLSCGFSKVLLWSHSQKPFTAYQHFDRHLL